MVRKYCVVVKKNDKQIGFIGNGTFKNFYVSIELDEHSSSDSIETLQHWIEGYKQGLQNNKYLLNSLRFRICQIDYSPVLI